jgi:Cellulose binding domain
MSQIFSPFYGRPRVRSLSGCFTVLTALLLTLVATGAHAQAACKVVYTISPQNNSAFGAAITVQNTGTTAWSSWSLSWAFANGQTVSSLWNGNEIQTGANVTVTNESYNGSIAAGGSLTGVGFNGTWNGVTNAAPASFAVNGTTCGGAATGSFSLTPATATETIAPSASVTDAITVTDLNGFTGAVSLAATSSNSGVTATVSGNVVKLTASSTATGTSTITITGTSGSLKQTTTIAVTVNSGTCTPTAITPFLQVNGAAWQQIATASVPAAATVNLGPQPPVTGTWSWTGPNGFTSAARQINAIALSTGVNVYVATYTNTANCKSTQAFTITEAGGRGGFTLTPAAVNEAITQGTSVTDAITVTDLNGFTGAVSLAATSSNSGVTATVSGDTLTLAASSSATGTATITVTGSSGSLTPVTTSVAVTVNPSTKSANATVTVNPSSPGVAVSDQLLGMNMAVWNDTTLSGAVTPFKTAGIKAVRWPGGSTADVYHWEGTSHTPSSPSMCPTGGFAFPSAAFANFVNDLAVPAGLDIALTADYGTNPTCNGGGLPSEAAAWVANALSLGVTVSHMTVGNEVYGHWETDMHSTKWDPTIYAAAVGNSTSNGYYQQIKTASPNTLVGIAVDAAEPSQNDVTAGWDPIVLANSQYDFVEYHYYPQGPGGESDTFLVQQAAQQLTTNINIIKTELRTAGHSSTPIYVGEMGSVSSNPGKQSWSITQGLFAGQVLGEMMNDGISRATWWIGFGNCNGTAGKVSASLYGFQNWGAYNVFSDGSADSNCPNAGPLGTLNPTARAFQLFSQVLINGEHVLTPSVTGDTTNVVAYAATHSGGEALVLFNRNENNNETVEINVSGKTTSSSVIETVYDKSIYAESASDVWAAPTTTNLGAQALPLILTLTPWSINVVIIH